MLDTVMNEIIKFLFESSITTKAVVIIAIAVYHWKDKKQSKIISKELKLLSLKHSATNYALEKSFKNGYKEYYDNFFKNAYDEDQFLK